MRPVALHSGAQGLATRRLVQATYAALPVDDNVASSFARLMPDSRQQGRRHKVWDMWIATTAFAHDAALFRQDTGFDGVEGVRVVQI